MPRLATFVRRVAVASRFSRSAAHTARFGGRTQREGILFLPLGRFRACGGRERTDPLRRRLCVCPLFGTVDSRCRTCGRRRRERVVGRRRGGGDERQPYPLHGRGEQRYLSVGSPRPGKIGRASCRERV